MCVSVSLYQHEVIPSASTLEVPSMVFTAGIYPLKPIGVTSCSDRDGR